MGKLFYAIALTGQHCNLGRIGLDQQAVHTVVHQDIAALVSDYPRVAAIKMLRKNLAPFHEVIRAATSRFTAIPARFGQIARDEGDVQLALKHHYTSIRRELEKLDGKVEMSIKVTWRAENLFAHLLEQDTELKARRDRLLGSGSVSNARRIEFGDYVFKRISQRREAIGRKIVEALPHAGVRFGEIHEEHTVANIALLIKNGLREELEQQLEAVANTLEGEFDVTLAGPWAPFNFAENLEFQLRR
jgi:hypothetical protein